MGGGGGGKRAECKRGQQNSFLFQKEFIVIIIVGDVCCIGTGQQSIEMTAAYMQRVLRVTTSTYATSRSVLYCIPCFVQQKQWYSARFQ
jgi:hypothetical protein